MERCPNCGSPGRLGAKFCTTCGFRFSGENDRATVDDAAGLSVPTANGETGQAAAEVVAGWPSAPASSEELDAGGLAQQSDPMPSVISESSDDAIGGVATGWLEDGVDAWPAPATTIANDANPEESSPDTDFASRSAADVNAPAANHAEIVAAVARAERLLNELRDTISAIGQETIVDLSGVISDLEVAVTPPGALAVDQVTELREALLAARERPRDVDTIVDITKRIDSMVALVFAYDRTIAAIERSLAVLRRTETRVIG